MSQSLRLIIAALFLCLLAAPVRGEVFPTMGARAMGMGGAFVAVANDGTAVHYNPAGLALNPTLLQTIGGLKSETLRGDFDTRLSHLRGIDIIDPSVYDDPDEVARIVRNLRLLGGDDSGAYGVTAYGIFAGKQSHWVSLTSYSFGHAFPQVDLSEEHLMGGDLFACSIACNESKLVTNGMTSRELVYTFAHSFFTEAFFVGLNVKLLDVKTYYKEESIFSPDISTSRSDLIKDGTADGEEKDRALSADVGFLYLFTPRARFAVVGRYLNGPSFRSSSPGGRMKLSPQVRAGASYYFSQFVIGAIDVDLTKNDTGVPGIEEQQAAAGLEWWVGKKKAVALRGGVNGDLAGSGNHSTVALGFGIRGRHVLTDFGVELLDSDQPKFALSFTWHR